MAELNEILSSFISELRRGTLVISVLSQLGQLKYGYSLVQDLEEKGVFIDPSTLYPLLRRLEKQELLTSEWETSTSKPRKYYKRTEFGNQVYNELLLQWRSISNDLNKLLEEENI